MNTLDFQPEAQRYYEEGHWRDGDLWSDFAARADEHPERAALILDERAVTYGELRRAALGVSARLAAANVTSGDVVILLGRHSIEAAVAMLGCLHLGVVLAPLPPMFNPGQLSRLIEQTGATAIVTFGGEKEIAKCREVERQVPSLLIVAPALVDAMIGDDAPAQRRARHADDLAMVMHSSGTTSAPKGIAHSSNTMRYATEALCRRWELTGDDIYLVVCEFGFVGGLIFGYFPVLLNGATGVLVNRWDAADALRLVEQHRCTYVLLMPTHAADVLDAARVTDRDLSSLRVLAAPGLTSERRLAMKEAFGLPPLADYGLSEVPGHAAHGLDEPEEKMIRTEGRPYEGTEIRIVDEAGRPLPAGTVGNVAVNGSSRFLGFSPQPGADAHLTHRLGRLSHRRPRDARRGRPLHVRRAQQGHHPPRRRHDPARRDRTESSSATRRCTMSPSCRCPTSASASGRARRSSPRRARPPRRSRSCRRTWSAKGSRSTRGRSRSSRSPCSRGRRR